MFVYKVCAGELAVLNLLSHRIKQSEMPPQNRYQFITTFFDAAYGDYDLRKSEVHAHLKTKPSDKSVTFVTDKRK